MLYRLLKCAQICVLSIGGTSTKSIWIAGGGLHGSGFGSDGGGYGAPIWLGLPAAFSEGGADTGGSVPVVLSSAPLTGTELTP